MPELLVVPLALAKLSGPAVATAFAPEPPQNNVTGGVLQPCEHQGGSTGFFRDNMCHAPGDPNHHEVCANITREFWPESGQGHGGIVGKWCICVNKLGDWLRGASAHHGISGIDCNATSIEALRGDPDAARFIAQQCPQVAQANVGSPLSMFASLELPRERAQVPQGVDDFL
eukprot:Skav222228  [mRNA]  locus=scaffold2099:64461:65076:+ [translate_table: standard]